MVAYCENRGLYLNPGDAEFLFDPSTLEPNQRRQFISKGKVFLEQTSKGSPKVGIDPLEVEKGFRLIIHNIGRGHDNDAVTIIPNKSEIITQIVRPGAVAGTEYPTNKETWKAQ